MDLPLRLGEPGEFARARALFARAGFSEERICRALDNRNMAQLASAPPEAAGLTEAFGSGALSALVQVFVLNQVVPQAEVEGALGPEDLAALRALDLLRLGEQGRYYAPAWVYPIEEFVIASDRHHSPEGSDIVQAEDVVFPALDPGTLRFLNLIPQSATGDTLDLCAGTGIGALVLRRAAKRVVAADITPRAAHFARFNALLNDCPDIEIALGDLYEPVAGQAFDRIVAHPPYVPALEQARIFRDGGTSGESILRRIIGELPRYLRPGGTFYCLAAAWDAAEGPLESRIRTWLGAPQQEFDVIFAEQAGVPPDRLARWLADKAGEPGLRQRWEEEFKAAGLQRNVYGAIVVHRAGAGEPRAARRPVAERPRLGPATDGACLEWSLRWYRWRADQEAVGELSHALLGSRLRLGPRLRARVTYVPREGELAASEIVLQADRPFRAATGIEPWMLKLLAGFGQDRTGAEVYEAARAGGQVPDGFEANDFATLVAMMVERGYLAIEGHAI